MFLVQLSTLSLLMLVAVYCIYVVFLPPVVNRSLSWNPLDMLSQVSEVDTTELLQKVTERWVGKQCLSLSHTFL